VKKIGNFWKNVFSHCKFNQKIFFEGKKSPKFFNHKIEKKNTIIDPPKKTLIPKPTTMKTENVL
jgi:hypothetical protein